MYFPAHSAHFSIFFPISRSQSLHGEKRGGRSDANGVSSDSLALEGGWQTCASISSPVASGHRELSRGVHEDQRGKGKQFDHGALELQASRAGPLGFFGFN